MSYDQYALIHAKQIRDRQIADAAEDRRARLADVRVARRSPLRPVGRMFVRLGHALGGEPDPTPLQPARSR